jgi:L-ascorbate metabolism protein UlaG (beta-lactamase superfamily)
MLISRTYSHRRYPCMRNGRFYNYFGEKKLKFLLPSLSLLCASFFTTAPVCPDLASWVQQSVPPTSSEQLTITWLGHASFLIQVNHINIVTDPVFGDISRLYPRLLPSGVSLEHLPPIDLVLISHNHRDHLDAPSIYTLARREQEFPVTFLVPKGDKQWFTSRNIYTVHEFMWWDRYNHTKNTQSIELSFLPAQHWSQRGLFDYNRSLWGSWMISSATQHVYFAGDTAYGAHFKAIAQEFPVITTALMPIGPCEPRKWMTTSHVSAEEAGQAFLDLQAHSFIPMHWGTYNFGSDSFLAPIERLTAWWQAHKQTTVNKQLYIVKTGKQYSIPEQPLSILLDRSRMVLSTAQK